VSTIPGEDQYCLEDFKDTFSRYLPSRNATPQQTLNDKDLEQNQNATPSNHVADKNRHKPLSDNVCRGVADGEGGKEDNSDEYTENGDDDAAAGSDEEETEWMF
jgi:hypothetical protein